MKQVFGICGMECSICPAFIAYKTDDDELRIKTAKQWSEWYSADIKPESINCIGCMEEGEPKVNFCSRCEIRTCGIEKKVVSCADCDEYLCEKINDFFKYLSPEAKENLENRRKSKS
ncbi:MAG: DUF3795 domain-containing protein [Caldisericia bacterium]